MKLYSKIFLSFLVTLVLAELVIFGIFRVFIAEDRHQRFHRLAEAQAVILRDWIEIHTNRNDCPQSKRFVAADHDRHDEDDEHEEHNDDADDDDHGRQEDDEHDGERHVVNRQGESVQLAEKDHKEMQVAVHRLSRLFRADIWVSDPHGKTLVRSFSGPVPPAPKYQQDFHNFSMGWGRRGEGFAKMPIRLPDNRSGRIFAHIPPEKRTPLESSFAWALGGLGLAFGLLLIPISRMLTGPLKNLRNSAARIAAGDLSQRVEVKGRDEISELSQTFNNMADKIERMVRGSRELTAHVSHELRSPLARMRIAEEMLRENIEAGDKQLADKRCDAIRAEIEDLDELIGKILTLSRLEMQAAPPRHEEVLLQDLAGDLIERYRPTLEKKKIKLIEELAPDTPAFRAVSGELRTLLANLLDNAVKFTPAAGDIRLSIQHEIAADETATQATDSGAILIECENLAEADDELDTERIFEPFFRKTTNGAGGTGLGLAITKKIVDNLGGTITASRMADRVNFHVRLPLPEEP